jgi:subtilase family serine protease
MRSFTCIVLGALAAVGAMAQSEVGAAAPYHQRLRAPLGWDLGPRAPATHVQTLTVALRHNDARMSAFRARVERIVDPSDPMHRQFLTREQVAEMTRADDTTVAAVRGWLEAGGAEVIETRSDALVARAPVKVLEAMFGSRFHAFRHLETGRLAGRAHGDSFLPEDVRREVAFFTGVFDMPFVPPKTKIDNMPKRAAGEGLSTYTIPTTLRNLHGIPETGDNVQGNSIGVVEFGQGAGFIKSDWSNFLTEVAGISDSPPYPTIVGPFTAKGDPNLDGECTLDIEVVSGLTTAPSYFITIGDGWIFDFASMIASASDRPTVYSISYGLAEYLTCEIVQCTPNPNDPSEYITRTEDELQKLAGQGLTVLVASGDTGAQGGRSPQDQNCMDTEHPLGPSYPATSAWVTAVGATMLVGDTPAAAGTSPYCSSGQFTPCSSGQGGVQQVCSYPDARITSGGGFSTLVEQPRYQQDAVARYVAIPGATPPAGMFNASLRAFPDVSSLGARCVQRGGGVFFCFFYEVLRFLGGFLFFCFVFFFFLCSFFFFEKKRKLTPPL